MKKVALVSGVRGFLGGVLANLLLHRGYQLVGLIRKGSEVPNYLKDVDIYESIPDIKRRVPNIDFVFHLAAVLPYKTSELHSTYYDSNIKLTEDLVQSFPASRFIFASSVSVYGDPAQLPLHVGSAINNPGPYGLSKIAGETLVKSLQSFSIIRFSSILGRGMRPVSMVPKMIEAARDNGVIKVLGRGNRLQNYIDVRDCASLCAAAAEYGTNITTLGVGMQSYSNREVAEIIANSMGVRIEYEDADEGRSYVYDVGKYYAELGFLPKYSLYETIMEMTR